MKILRLFTIRVLLSASLVAALALPPGALIETAAAETTASPSSPITTVKKTTKKAGKKSGKKTRKKTTKKAGKKAGKKTVKRAAKTVAKPRATPVVAPVVKPIAAADRYASVAKDGVFVRANPSSDAEMRWEIFARFPLQIKKRQGEWLQVSDFEGDTGWIHESLVTAEKSVIVRKKKIQLREDPNNDPNNPIVANVKYGVIFTPVEKNGEWLKVSHVDKIEGWLNKDSVWPSDPLD